MPMIREPVTCEDEGFFGPDSISWRVNGPTILPGLVYSGVMFFLNPWNATIGVRNTSGFMSPMRRVVLTGEYMYAITFGDKATARHAARIVNNIHDHVTGTWAPTGDRVHSASEPRNLMWLLIPFGQGMLDAYDAYGPKRLTLEERDRYWREENTIVGELNRIPDELLPKSQAEVNAYLEEERANFAITEAGLSVTDLLSPSPLAGLVPAAAALPARAIAASGFALLPDYAMHLLGRQPYSRAKKLAIRAAHRPLYASLGTTPLVRDAIPLAVSGSCRRMVRRARAAARTGNYDTPRGSTPARNVSRLSA